MAEPHYSNNAYSCSYLFTSINKLDFLFDSVLKKSFSRGGSEGINFGISNKYKIYGKRGKSGKMERDFFWGKADLSSFGVGIGIGIGIEKYSRTETQIYEYN